MSKLVQNHSNTTNQTSCTCIQLLSDVPVHPSMHDKPFVLAAPRDGFPTKVRVLSTNLTNSNCSVGPTFVTQTTIHEPVHKTTNKLSWKQAESSRPLFKFMFTLWNKVAKKEQLFFFFFFWYKLKAAMAVQLQNALRSLAVLYGRTLQSCACSNTPRLLDRSGLCVFGMFLLLKVYPQTTTRSVCAGRNKAKVHGRGGGPRL